MPPKNRKKKPQSNPARGFATTSVPSKVKPEAEKEEETEAVQVEPANEAPGTEKDNEKPPQDELNYEDHKLRELVEKYGPKVKKEATRYVEKLQAEKRLFRTSSSSAATQAMYPIYVEGAFGLHKEDRKSALRQNKDGSSTLGIADKIFNLAKEEAEAAWSSKKKRKIPGNYFGKVGETELIQSWMLYKTLISLGFQKAQVEKAIEDVVGYERVGVVSGKYNDSILGGIEPTGDLSNSLLREVLDYLVLMEADEQDLPPYVGKTGGEKKEDNVVEEPEVASETPPNNQRANRGPVSKIILIFPFTHS